MTIFVHIILKIMLPIMILISVGFIANKSLNLDSRTFAKLFIYVFVPAIFFSKIYYASVPLKEVWFILAYIMAIQVLMLVIAALCTRIFAYPRSKSVALGNAIMYFNSGNYGLPLADLVFKGLPNAITIQVLIMLIQNITSNTFGVFRASSANSSRRQSIRNMLEMPTLYVLAVVLIVRLFRIEVPEQILVPLKYVSDGFIGFALIALGVQLAEIKLDFRFGDVLLPCCIRLLLSPLLGYLIVLALGVKGIMAQSMVIGVATPTAVNTAILALQYNNESEYASRIVYFTTLFSPVSLSLVIFCATNYL
ncbi:MAG TPA: AEC family transporter [Desulfuromonadales bacterium]|nr:AEC family transporter [Desulfuromonadales bacterium]